MSSHPTLPTNTGQPAAPCRSDGYRLIFGALGLLLLGVGGYALAFADNRGLLGYLVSVSLVLVGGNALYAAWRGRRCWLSHLGPLP